MRTVSRRIERVLQGNKRNRWFIRHWSAYRQGEQSEVEKYCHRVNWHPNGQWYILAILDNRLSENQQDIRQNINFITKSMKNWKVKLSAGGKTSAEGKNLERHLLGRCIVVITVIAMIPFNHILGKCFGVYKFTKSQEKINHLMDMDDIKVFSKNEKELETLMQTIKL